MSETARLLLFDLDGTLYPSTYGVERRIIPQAQLVAARALGMTLQDALPTIHRWARIYGHIALGVEAETGTSSTAFIDEVHEGIEIQDIAKNEHLSMVLESLAEEYDLALLTNSPASHATRILSQIAIDPGLFKTRFSIEDFGFALKPDPRAFKLVIKRTGIPPKYIHYYDDSIRNVHSAWRLGFDCTLVWNGLAERPYFWENHFQIKHFPPDHIPCAYDLATHLEERYA